MLFRGGRRGLVRESAEEGRGAPPVTRFAFGAGFETVGFGVDSSSGRDSTATAAGAGSGNAGTAAGASAGTDALPALRASARRPIVAHRTSAATTSRAAATAAARRAVSRYSARWRQRRKYKRSV